MIIRPPKPEDNEQLIELDRISPEEGLISYYVDRRPSYVRYPETKGFFPYVAEEDERVVGVVFSALDDLYVKGELRRCDYISSLRVHPKYRNRGIGSALINHAIDKGIEEGAEIFWAIVLGKNEASFRTFSRCGFRKVGGFPFKVMTMRVGRKSSNASLREATQDDLKDMRELIESFYGGYNFKPRMTMDWLASRYRVRERSLGNFYVAEYKGRVVATLRAVKQWQITRMVITKLSWGAKLASLVLRLGMREGSLLRMMNLSNLSFVEGGKQAAFDLIGFAKKEHSNDCRIAYIQYARGGREEPVVSRLGGLMGYTDVMAMSPSLRFGRLDPIFPSR